MSQAFENKLSVRWGNAVGGFVGGHGGCYRSVLRVECVQNTDCVNVGEEWNSRDEKQGNKK